MEPTEAHAVTRVRKPHCLKRVSSTITNGLEAAFFHVGHFVGEYPVLTIILSLIICGLCGIGLKTFKETDNQVDLWVPQDSRIINEKTWVDKTFPDRTRFVAMVLESGTNVLTPTFLKAMMDYYSRSVGITVSGSKFSNFCLKVGGKCRLTSLLELWDYNATIISRLTQPEILDKINDTPVSPSFGYEVSTLLGGKITRVNGRIEGATATQVTWVTSGQTQKVKDWESNMIGIARNGHPRISTTYVYASRSFDDEGYGAVDDDISLLTAGFSIVFIFVILSLGKFNLMEQKIYVSLAGMLCVGLALLFAYGLATAMDLIYSPIQSIMPFLLLGIGVDDMFVVVEAWKNLSPEENALSVPNKMATTLKQAGVSITVTSVTDAVAFGVGASTVIPALSAFCVYAVLGIFALFVLVSTFFSACLSLDERRRRRNLDACVLCYQHKDYTPNKCSQGSSLLQVFFAKFYGPVLMKLPVKTCVVIVTLIIFAVNVWSFTQLKQEFKLATYIPSDSYAYQFVDAKERLFDTEGIDTAVYCGGFNYQAYRSQLEAMHRDISVNSYVQNGTVNAWFINYHTWLNQTGRVVATESQYASNLKQFLSGSGNSLTSFVKFNSNSNPTAITGSYMTLRHVRESNSASEIESMESLRSIVDGSGLPQHEESNALPTHKCFAYSPSYLTYETNKVLLLELYRNLGLAGAAVLIVTCVLIANLWTSLLVFFCVIFTVVDVAGTLQFWGTSIDTASSILLTLTVGLAVDYSAHIGHTFMTISGPRKERTVATLRNIGPAVFNGGFSTFLAFVLLANSSSYGFVVFFRVFSTVVLFGLFHGLAFLPVLLSIVGPPAYMNADIIPKSRELTVRPDPGAGKETSAAESVQNGEPHHIEPLLHFNQ
ncbi:patched domain-containing protein 3-like isoform X2 [Littorina saxatilis]|uniref:patched domain-containing protein 3-like isoform X2 n=1 Tax=Littorina saxatilis TaxID=31220 RepID=UPI0038B5796E